MDDISLDIATDINDLFGVDEDSSQPVSSSPALVMPQFYCEDSPDKAISLLRDPQHRPSPNPWDPRLVMDLAIGVDGLDDILLRYGLTQEDYDALTTVPTFRRELSTTLRELRENGVTFIKKAKIQAESYLVDLDDMVQDKNVPAATRLDAIKSIVKWGGLEPKDTKTEQAQGVTVNLQINYSN